MTRTLSSIAAMAAHRPPGYYEDVLSRGTVIGDKLKLTPEAYAALRAKYAVKPWPLWARAMRFFREDEDAGIGDTIARVIGPARSNAFKDFYHRTFGKDCGCSNRQKYLNEVYPYDPNSHQP